MAAEPNDTEIAETVMVKAETISVSNLPNLRLGNDEFIEKTLSSI